MTEKRTVSNLNDFMEWIQDIATNNEPYNFLYRGVPSETYDIGEASAYRRLRDEKDRIPPKLIEINQSLIDNVRARKFDHKYGRELSDLEILAELQHLRAATCLIDFTFNPLVALWFACEPINNEDQKDGKVGAVHNDYSITRVRPEWLQQSNTNEVKDIGFFFQMDKNEDKYPLYLWQPYGLNNRILSQDAVFLFGAAPIEAKECVITEECKSHIREELKRYLNISADTLFPDYEGFAEQMAHDVPYIIPDYTKIGLQAHQNGEYKRAIDYYTKAINLDPDNSEGKNDYIYRLSGMTHTKMNEKELAITDYDKALKLNPDNIYALGDRGLANAKFGQYEAAIEDFNKALKLKPNNPGLFSHRGKVKYHYNQPEAAIEDFNKALEIYKQDTLSLHYLGKIKYDFNQYEEAIDYLKKALSLTHNDPNMYYDLGKAYEKVKIYNEAQYNYLMASDLAHPDDTDFRNEVAESLDRIDKLIHQ